MKVILLFSFLMALRFPIGASYYSISSSSNKVRIGNGESKVVLEGKNFLVDTPHIKVGTSASINLLQMIEEPFILSPVTPPLIREGESRLTSKIFIVIFKSFSIFSFSRGGGLSFFKENFSFSAIYQKGIKDSSYQKNSLDRLDRDCSWFMFNMEYPSIELRTILSLSQMSKLSGLIRLSVKYNIFEVGLGRGRIQLLTKKENVWDSYLSLQIKDEALSASYELYIKDKPIYQGEFRDYDYNSSVTFNFREIQLKNTTKKSFISGKEKREEKISIKWRCFTLGTKDLDSLFFILESEKVKVEIAPDELSVKIERMVENDKIKFSLELSNKKPFSFEVTVFF